jgi:hypothetical protein
MEDTMRIKDKNSRRAAVTAFSAVLLVGICAGCGGTSEKKQAQESATPPAAAPPKPGTPQVKKSAAVAAKAENPKPAVRAQKKTAADGVGKGSASYTAKGHPAGSATFWAEEMDVDDSGNPVLVDVGLDKKDKVLYVAKERTFSCSNGGTADGEVLMAVYGKGNTKDKPAGSGWFVAELDAGECGVPTAGLYGCKFDADGNPTECGGAVVQEEADDVTITPLPQGGPGAPSGGQ